MKYCYSLTADELKVINPKCGEKWDINIATVISMTCGEHVPQETLHFSFKATSLNFVTVNKEGIIIDIYINDKNKNPK